MKRPFTLIEVLIASVLGVFLLVSLMQLLIFSRGSESASRQIANKALQWLEAKEQIEECLSRADLVRFQGEKESSPGLFFSFDNGIDIDPDFCGTCKARLWHEKGDLFLSIYGREKVRTKELLNAARGDIAFYLWCEGKKKPVESALLDRSVQCVIVAYEDKEIICHLLHAPSVEVSADRGRGGAFE